MNPAFNADDYPWFPLFGERWLLSKGVRLMSYEQRGIYMELLCIAWRDQGIPSDLEDVAALLGIEMDRLEAAWRRVGKLFVAVEGRPEVLVNPWQEEIRAEQIEKRERRAAAGRKGNNQRWGSQSDRNATGTGSQEEGEGEVEQKEQKEKKAPPFDQLRAIWEALPETHRTQAVGEALKAYLAIRKEQKSWPKWKAAKCASLAKEFGELTPNQVVATLTHSTRNTYQGLFPDKFTATGAPGLQVQTGGVIVATTGLTDAQMEVANR